MAEDKLVRGLPITQERTEAFWNKIAIGKPSECWPYKPPSRTQGGYGAGFYGDVRTTAHRIAYILSNGRFPAIFMVLHRCDNPICCNPQHLFLGTAKDNSEDMVRKGRWSRRTSFRGDGNPNAKVTASQLPQLFEDAKTMTQRVLGAKYGISKSQIGNILRGESRN